MVFDLHSHTYYSQCGRDDPHELCEAAISGGIELFGICDHNYGITRDGNAEHIREYFDMLTELREEYRGRLSIARGIELSTMDDICLGDNTDISYFDYALIENIDAPDSILYLPKG